VAGRQLRATVHAPRRKDVRSWIEKMVGSLRDVLNRDEHEDEKNTGTLRAGSDEEGKGGGKGKAK